MRAGLSVIAGTVGQCFVTAADVTTLVFLAMGNGRALALAGVILIGWLAIFWCALLALAATAQFAGVLRLPKEETTNGH